MNGLLTDLYELTMAAGYFEAGKTEEIATFEFTIRRLPENRNFVIAAGLPQAVDYLLNLSFSAEEGEYEGPSAEEFDGTYSYTASVKVGPHTLTSTAKVTVDCPLLR